MSKQLPPSYLVRHGDKTHAWRFRSRTFARRKLAELNWAARAIIVLVGVGVALIGNLIPVMFVAMQGSATVGSLLIAICAAALQITALGWVWLRSKHPAWSKLLWSFKLAVPVLGIIFFAAFYEPPALHDDADERRTRMWADAPTTTGM